MADEPRDVDPQGVPAVPGEEGMSRQEDEPGGADVPGVDVGQPDAPLPPEPEEPE